MVLSGIGLSARALVRLGALPITSFDDGSAESEIASILYSTVRDALLSSYAWTFASGQIALTQQQAAPLADFEFSYALPNDYLRAISLGAGGTSKGVPYRISRNVLHTNAQNVTLHYIFRPDESEFPAYFDQALIAKLAAEFCIPVTESTSRANSLFSLAEREYARARQIDAQSDTPNRLDDFTLVDVRG